MDVRLFGRVLWRFKWLVASGFVLAVVLASLSMVKVGSHGVRYRGTELFTTTSRLGVTQNGFPWGRLFAETQSASGVTEPTSGIPVANPDRLNALAVLYAQLATSDPVRAIMKENGPVTGQILATALRDASSGTLLPLIDVTAIASSPEAAVALAKRSAGALETYVEQQQRTNRSPTSDRVIVQEVAQPTKVTVYQARSKTMPVLAFLVVMFATIGLAFLLENTRPARRLAETTAPELAAAKARLSA